MYILNLKTSFLPVKTSSSITLMSGVQNCDRVLEPMIQYIVLAVGPHVHIASTWHHSRDECSQAFPILHKPCIIVNANGEGLGTRLIKHLNYLEFQLHESNTNLWCILTGVNLTVASFPGSPKLSVSGKSSVSFLMWAWCNWKIVKIVRYMFIVNHTAFHVLFNWLHTHTWWTVVSC